MRLDESLTIAVQDALDSLDLDSEVVQRASILAQRAAQIQGQILIEQIAGTVDPARVAQLSAIWRNLGSALSLEGRRQVHEAIVRTIRGVAEAAIVAISA